MRYRRTILELLLAAHDRDCTTCVKSGECHLLELAHRMGVDRIRFKNREAKYPIDESSPAIVRNPNKCILCGDCVRMCDNVQSVNAIDFAYRGTSAGDPGLQQDHRPDQLRQLRPVPGGVSHRRDQHQDQHR